MAIKDYQEALKRAHIKSNMAFLEGFMLGVVAATVLIAVGYFASGNKLVY
jgi:hypothetical protein